MEQKRINRGFTLAEILIVTGIIGLIAVLVIPRLVSDVQSFAWGKSKENSLAIITEATKEMKTNDVLYGYTSNSVFVDVFSKYISVLKRCDSTHLTECFVPSFKTSNGSVIDVSTLSDGTKLHKNNLAQGTISMILKNGTMVLFSLKDPAKATIECARIETWNNTSNTTACLSFLYDVNGKAGPNIMGKDIGTLFASDFSYAIELSDGTKLGYAFSPTAMSYSDCVTKGGSLGISACYNLDATGGDYWAGAAAQCGGAGNLPTREQLDKLANEFFDVSNCGDSACSGVLDYIEASKIGLPSSDRFYVWSTERNSSMGYMRIFDPGTSSRSSMSRGNQQPKALCIK